MKRVNDLSTPAEVSDRVRAWFDTPLGRSLQAMEVHHLRSVLPSLYGKVGIQLGRIGRMDFLDACAAPTRVLLDARDGRAPARDPGDASTALADFTASLVLGAARALPFDQGSVDIALLPHTLDFTDDPHQVLRDVARVLSAEGHVVILGFNPFSLWGMRRMATKRPRPAPWCGNFLHLSRIKDWLALLDLELTQGNMLYYRPPFNRDGAMDRLYFLERTGDRWWPMLAAVYLLVAKKRVLGMTPLPLAWKTPKTVGVPAGQPAVRASLQQVGRRAAGG